MGTAKSALSLFLGSSTHCAIWSTSNPARGAICSAIAFLCASDIDAILLYNLFVDATDCKTVFDKLNLVILKLRVVVHNRAAFPNKSMSSTAKTFRERKRNLPAKKKLAGDFWETVRNSGPAAPAFRGRSQKVELPRPPALASFSVLVFVSKIRYV